MKPRHSKRLLSTAALMVVTLSTAAHSQTRVHWTGSVSTDWNNGANWDTGAVPSNSNNEHAVVNLSAPNIATISANLAATPVDIIVGVDSAANGRLDHTAGTAATGTGNWMFVGTNGGTGTYNLANTAATGGTTTGFGQGTGSIAIGGRLYVGGLGGTPGSNGIVNVHTAGTLGIATELRVGTSNSTGVLNIDSGSVTTGEWTIIGGGENSLGTLNMSGGSMAKAGGNHFIVGDASGTGIANISGGSLQVNNEIWIGQGGGSNGSLNLSGGQISTNSWFLAGRAGGTGTVTMSGGSITKTGSGNFVIGDIDSNGTFVQSDGTISSNGEFWVGRGNNAVGAYNLSGGTLNHSGWVVIGVDNGSGTVNMTGGTWNKTGGGNFIVGASGPGTMTHSGGLVDVQSGLTWIGERSNAVADYTLSGTGEFRSGEMIVALNGGSTGTVNLDGGRLVVGQIRGGAGSDTINFNGTQILATGNHSNFIGGLEAANINPGGLRIDSQQFGVASDQAFAGAGGVTKSGTGSLTLSGESSYTGPTSVTGGTLVVSNNSTGGGSFEVASGTTLGVDSLLFDTSLEVSSASFAAGSNLEIDVRDHGNPTTAPLDVAGVLQRDGVVTVNFRSELPTVGRFPLIAFGSLAGTGSFVLGTLPLGVEAELVTTAGTVDLNITKVTTLVWEGGQSNVWDTTTMNWLDGATMDPVLYTDGFPVTFDFNGFTSDVVLNATVSPSSVVFDTSGLDYTLTGTGRIGGSTGLTKTGPGSLTLGTANTYMGMTRLEEGTVSVSTLADGGLASPLGAAPAAASNLVMAGGTLNYTGPATSTNRGLTLEGQGSTIANESDLTWSGEIRAIEGQLTKTGAGSLILSHPGANQLGAGGPPALRIDGGTLVLEGSGTQTNTVAGELWIAAQPDVPAHLVLNNTSLATSGWLALGHGNGDVTSSLTATNSTLENTNFHSGFNAGMPGQNSLTHIELTDTVWTNNGFTNIAESPGSTSTMILNGNSRFITPLQIFIGQLAGSNGSVVLKGTSQIVQTGGWLAVAGSGTGILTLQDSSKFTNTAGDFNVADLADSNGTLVVQNNATVSSASVYVGKGAGSIGTVNQSGGTFNSGGDIVFFIGSNGNGVWNQSAGTVNAAGWLVAGRFAAGVGELNISGGTFNQTAPDRFLQIGEEGTGVVNLSGSGVLNIASTGNGVILGSTATGTGTLNLNGGTLVTNRLMKGPGTGTLNFNGGVLRARTGANPDFLNGLTSANVLSGGAIIDSNGIDIAVGQSLTGSGSLTKQGTGTLVLSNTNSYTGNTTVLDGTLTLEVPGLSDSGTVTIGGSAGSTAVLHLPNVGTDVVAALIIDGVAQPLGVYNSSNSGGAITGDGELQVNGTAASPFTTWIAGHFPGESDPNIVGPTADPDRDGQSNSVEFALGGNPANGSDNAKTYVLKADSSMDPDSLPELLMTLAVRSGTPAFAGNSATHNGVTYTVTGSTNLAAWDRNVQAVTPIATGLPAAPAGYEYRTFSLENSNGLPDRGFLRVHIGP